MKTKQKLVMGYASSFESTLGKWLDADWRVVLGTLGGASFRCLPEMHQRRNKAGETFVHRMWCVVEKSEVHDGNNS